MRIGITLTSSLDVDRKYIDLTDRVASAIAENGHGIVYGGTAYGMMERLAERYKSSGGNDLCGVMAKDLMTVTKGYEKFPDLDEEILLETVSERKQKIIGLSDAFLILPGGYGTFEEIGTIIGGQANKLYSKPIGFLNFEGYYEDLFLFLEKMFRQRFSRIGPQDLFFQSDKVDEILSFFDGYTEKTLRDKFA